MQTYLVVTPYHIAETTQRRAVQLAKRWGCGVIFKVHWKRFPRT